MLLEGIHLPLTTPFHPDGRLNVYKLEHNVERYSRTPVAGLVLFGANGEAAALTDAETRQAMKTVGAVAAHEKVLLAGVGRASVFATLEMAEAAAEAGFDAALVGVPLAGLGYSDLELRTYFEMVADRAALPLVLVSDEVGEIPMAMLVELASHERILGVVDSGAEGERLAGVLAGTQGVGREVAVTQVFAAATGRMLKAGQPGFVSAESLGGGTAIMTAGTALKTRMKRVGFQVLAGKTEGMLAGFEGGAVGAVPGFGACAPQVCNEVYQAWKDGDLELAREKQVRIVAAGRRVEGSVAAIKYGCDLNGYFGGRGRLPVLGLTAVERGEVEREMVGLRN